MKKIYFLFLLASCAWISQASTFEVLAEGTVAYLQPIGGRFQKIYGGSGIYGGELTFPLNFCCYKFGPWIGASYFTRHGKSFGTSCCHYSTNVQFVPVDFGIKIFAPIKYAELYFGLGGRYAFLTTHDHYQFGKNPVHKNSCGVIVKAGGLFDVFQKAFLDVFVNYSFNSFNGTHSPGLVPVSADVNTISVGIGIGYRFGCL